VEPALDRGQRVHLILDGGRHLTARVAALGADVIDLEPDAAAAVSGQPRWCVATMTWATRLGAARRHGVLVVGEPDGTLRLHAHRPAHPVQRRAFVRVPAEVTAAVIAPDQRVTARTLDLSLGGMLLATDLLPTPTAVRFALDLGPLTVSGGGEVVRAGDGACAVRFAAVQGRVELALGRFIAARQRELLHGDAATPPARPRAR
jgi:hypothetical protein